MTAASDQVVIVRAPSTVLAEDIQSLLAAEGIDAFLDPYSAEEVVAGELYTEFTGVDVRVRAADAVRARAVIDEAHESGRILKEAADDEEQAADFGG